MAKPDQTQGRGGRYLTAAATGICVAFGVCLVILVGCAGMVSAGKLGETAMTSAGILACALGCLAGGWWAVSACRGRALLVGLGIGLGFWLVWLLFGKLFYTAVAPETGTRYLLASLAGGAAAAILASGRTRK